jgi:hypothetical protein
VIQERLIGGGYIEVRDGFLWQSKCEDRLENDGNFARSQRDKSNKRWSQKHPNPLNGHNSRSAGADTGGDVSPSPSPNKNTHTVENGLFDSPATATKSNDFETFWRAYPSRASHANPKKPAAQKFELAIKRGIVPAVIIRGAQNYAEIVRREGTEPRFIAQAQTWLHQERWTEYQRSPESEKTHTKEFVP